MRSNVRPNVCGKDYDDGNDGNDDDGNDDDVAKADDDVRPNGCVENDSQICLIFAVSIFPGRKLLPTMMGFG